MIPSNRTFNGKNSYEDDGKTIYRYIKMEETGDYDLRFRFISTNSPFQQGIVIGRTSNPPFKGIIQLDGHKIPQLKKRYAKYIINEGVPENNEFVFNVHAEEGALYLYNASGKISNVYGCAFWIEKMGENLFRFHCNDHEYDDDFDDLIFDMEVIRK